MTTDDTDTGEDARELKPAAATAIDENLRRVYRDLESQELPDRFAALLDQLRAGGAEETGS